MLKLSRCLWQNTSLASFRNAAPLIPQISEHVIMLCCVKLAKCELDCVLVCVFPPSSPNLGTQWMLYKYSLNELSLYFYDTIHCSFVLFSLMVQARVFMFLVVGQFPPQEHHTENLSAKTDNRRAVLVEGRVRSQKLWFLVFSLSCAAMVGGKRHISEESQDSRDCS